MGLLVLLVSLLVPVRRSVLSRSSRAPNLAPSNGRNRRLGVAQKDAQGRETGETSAYLAVNRGKRSVAIDISKLGGQALVKQLGGWLDDRDARQRAGVAGRAVIDRLGGALDKTMAALEPYLLQLRLESGTAHA